MASNAAPTGTRSQPASVFVSYSRDDQKHALPIIQLIENAGYSVWWDGLLGGGERYSQTTQAALDDARAVVVLWSHRSVASHWVHDEATRGRDRRCLVPVSIDGVAPPLGFGQFQTIDMSHAKPTPGDPCADSLLRAITALHDGPAVPTARVEARRGVDRRMVVGGGLALAFAGAIGTWWSGVFRSGGGENSVAVLPFDNMSGDPAQDYFSDGVAAEVRSQLAQNPLLRVAAQASSAQFREGSEDARSIATKLNVAHLLDGNIRKSGNMVRVSVELTEGATGFTKWSQRFDRPLADVFAVQDEIARAVTAALTAQLAVDGPTPKRTSEGTRNIAAYDAYLRGVALYQLSSGEGVAREALAKFDEAVALDADYAAAWSARSRSLAAIANQYLDGSARSAMFGQAITSAQRAVQLNPNLADAHSALGYATFFGRRNAKAARAPFDRSAELGQGESDVLTRYGLYCARIGRAEAARAALGRAIRLDPLNPLAQRAAGTVEFAARRYDQAIVDFEAALKLNPEMSGTHAAIGFSQLLLGRIDQAAASFARESSALRRLTGVAMVAQRQGKASNAQAALDQIERDFGTSALYEQAQVYAQWGDVPRAMAALRRAKDTGDPGLVLIQSDPLIDPLRRAPGFSDLLRAAGYA